MNDSASSDATSPDRAGRLAVPGAASQHTCFIRDGPPGRPERPREVPARCSCGWAGRARLSEPDAAIGAHAHIERVGSGRLLGQNRQARATREMHAEGRCGDCGRSLDGETWRCSDCRRAARESA